MRSIFIILCMLFMVPVFADTMPYYVDVVPKSAIGVYQTGDKLTVYAQPESNSEILKEFKFTYCQPDMPDESFALLINDRKLGFLYVTDVGDENWVEVIYDKTNGAKGWVMTEDRFQFLPWINFYNMYGRKYGLRIFKDAPDEVDVLRSAAEDKAQSVAKINYVKTIKLTKLSGNWVLVSVLDLDKIPKTGYMRWRSDEGTIYAFPNIK